MLTKSCQITSHFLSFLSSPFPQIKQCKRSEPFFFSILLDQLCKQLSAVSTEKWFWQQQLESKVDLLHMTSTKDIGEHESFPLIYLKMLRGDHTGHLFFTHRYKVHKVYKGIQLPPYFSLTSTASVNRRSHGRENPQYTSTVHGTTESQYREDD